MKHIHVMFAQTDGTVVNANFDCEKPSITMFRAGRVVITFRQNPGYHVEAGRRIAAAQFARASAVYLYEDDE